MPNKPETYTLTLVRPEGVSVGDMEADIKEAVYCWLDGIRKAGVEVKHISVKEPK